MVEFVYDGESVERAEDMDATADIKGILDDHWQEYERRETEYGGTPSYELTGMLAQFLNDGVDADDDFGYDVWDVGHIDAEGMDDAAADAYAASIEDALDT